MAGHYPEVVQLNSSCRICGNSNGNKQHWAREMMFGMRDKFTYIECSACGCLQIKEYPKNLNRYYPENYFSFKKMELPTDNFIKQTFLHNWVKYALTGKGHLGKLIAAIKPMPSIYLECRKFNISVNSRILDVGCGNGEFLITLHRAGFRNLLGIDSFISGDINYSSSLHIKKMRLQDLSDKFDLITLNHSFEHMNDPLDVMNCLLSLLSDDGVLIIRIPVLGFAWLHYGVNWVQMDPPRHFYLHSIKSLEILANKTGLKLKSVICDSDEFQFCGSEQIMRNIPLMRDSSSPDTLHFSKSEIQCYREKAKELNDALNGDQAIFYLMKH